MSVFNYKGKQIDLCEVNYLSSSTDGKEINGRFQIRTDRLALVLKNNSFILIEGYQHIKEFLKVWAGYKMIWL